MCNPPTATTTTIHHLCPSLFSTLSIPLLQVDKILFFFSHFVTYHPMIHNPDSSHRHTARQTPQTDASDRQIDTSDRQTDASDRRLRQTDRHLRQTDASDRRLRQTQCSYLCCTVYKCSLKKAQPLSEERMRTTAPC